MIDKFKLILLTLIIFSLSRIVSAEVAPGFNTWEDVKDAANGGQVNVYMWGGSDAINGFVDDFYGVPLKNDYNITLNRVPLAGTVDAVNQVLSEKEAGVTGDNGNIDLIWINGENFWTLKQADLLYGPFAGFTTKFLKQSSYFDLFSSIKKNNIFSMLDVGFKNNDLINYLISQSLKVEQTLHSSTVSPSGH